MTEVYICTCKPSIDYGALPDASEVCIPKILMASVGLECSPNHWNIQRLRKLIRRRWLLNFHPDKNKQEYASKWFQGTTVILDTLEHINFPITSLTLLNRKQRKLLLSIGCCIKHLDVDSKTENVFEKDKDDNIQAVVQTISNSFEHIYIGFRSYQQFAEMLFFRLQKINPRWNINYDTAKEFVNASMCELNKCHISSISSAIALITMMSEVCQEAYLIPMKGFIMHLFNSSDLPMQVDREYRMKSSEKTSMDVLSMKVVWRNMRLEGKSFDPFVFSSLSKQLLRYTQSFLHKCDKDDFLTDYIGEVPYYWTINNSEDTHRLYCEQVIEHTIIAIMRALEMTYQRVLDNPQHSDRYHHFRGIQIELQQKRLDVQRFPQYEMIWTVTNTSLSLNGIKVKGTVPPPELEIGKRSRYYHHRFATEKKQNLNNYFLKAHIKERDTDKHLHKNITWAEFNGEKYDENNPPFHIIYQLEQIEFERAKTKRLAGVKTQTIHDLCAQPMLQVSSGYDERNLYTQLTTQVISRDEKNRNSNNDDTIKHDNNTHNDFWSLIEEDDRKAYIAIVPKNKYCVSWYKKAIDFGKRSSNVFHNRKVLAPINAERGSNEWQRQQRMYHNMRGTLIMKRNSGATTNMFSMLTSNQNPTKNVLIMKQRAKGRPIFFMWYD